MKRLHDGHSGSNLRGGRDFAQERSDPPPTKRIELRDSLSLTYGPTVLEIFGVWLVDRCRINADGSHGDYVEQYIPWYVLEQCARGLHTKPGFNFYRSYIKSVNPCYGLLVHRIDHSIWCWFLGTSQGEPLQWFEHGKEPLDIHTNEYLEISCLNLRGNYNAFKKFPDLND